MTKNSYAQFNDARAYQDKNTGDIHLTIKDPRFKDGFKLTLNAGRKEELALREILDAENKSVPLPVSTVPQKALYDYHLPSLNSGPLEGEFEGYSYDTVSTSLRKMATGSYIPLGATGEGRFENFFWDFKAEQNMLIAANKKSGLTTFLRSMIRFIGERPEALDYFVIDGGNKNIVDADGKNFTTLEGALKLIKGLVAASCCPDYFTNSMGIYGNEFNGPKSTILFINELEKLRPENPNSWSEIVMYEQLIDMVRSLEGSQGQLGINIVRSTENFGAENVAPKKYFYYKRRTILGPVPLSVSEAMIKEGNDSGVRIPKIPGRGITYLMHISREGFTNIANGGRPTEFQAYQMTTNKS